ncbi:MAG TPA: helix-turn-helix domain-containing protein [Vicinamibacterales bacterium]|nr:helix-turn-helix domain-containing protein [Vicinamibacterales bacterium]
MNPLVLDVKAAAEATGMSEWMLRRYVRDGLLPTVKYPGRYDGETSRRILIAVEDLQDFVRRHRRAEP